MEKAKRGNLWHWVERKMIDTFTQAGTGQLIVNNNITVTRRGLVVSARPGACALRGPLKGNLTLQRYVILDAKRPRAQLG